MRYAQLLIMLVLFAAGPVMAIEEPNYEVLKSAGAYEIRQYDTYIVAEVDIDASAREAGNRAFSILAGYIFGKNAEREKMNMTAPVSTEDLPDGGYTYAFVMESKYSMDTLPAPNDPRIRLVQKPPQIVAVHRYSGLWSERNYAKNTDKLKKALAADGIDITGEPMLARYNSPFTPWFARRNEVLIEVAWPATNL